MKNVKFGFLALSALLGITSAFTTKSHSNLDSRSYGITGKFVADGVNHYSIQLKNGFCTSQLSSTCSGTVSDNGITLSTVLTSALTVTVANAAYNAN